jgi:aminopeptidase
MSGAHQWLVCRVPTAAWADRMFPDLPAVEREQALWDAIFSACRLYEADPDAAWRGHIGKLIRRRDCLDAKRYTALHFRSLECDLRIGLAEGHRWEGGQAVARTGVRYIANMPTEEVFTLPDRRRTEGTMTTTYPVSLKGVLLERARLTFENGRVTHAHAEKGQAALEKLLETDEGASHLGEVALVPVTNAVARPGRLYYEGLYDENVASHVAVGRGYRFAVQGGTEMTPAEFDAAGGNESMIHEDLLIGGATMDVDGICADGSREPVMRAGEWTLEV